MPKLRSSIESALGTKPAKKEEPKAEAKPKVKDLVRAHVDTIISRHKSLPATLVDSFYQCSNKSQVKRLLRDWLRQNAV
jgi:hypothetical protein